MNPTKAGLVKNPRKYRWSSSRLYCDSDAPKSFISPGFILGLLSGRDFDRKEQYRLMLMKGLDLKTDQVLEQEGAIESFRSKLAAIFPTFFNRADKKRKISRFSGLDLLSLEELEKQLEAIRKGAFPNKPESRKAKKFLIEQLIFRGFKRAEIAERLGVSAKTVYNILKSPL